MNRYLKLSEQILNTRYIQRIVVKPQVYHLYTHTYDADGYTIMGTGAFSTKNNRIDICEERHPHDYKVVSEWIKTL